MDYDENREASAEILRAALQRMSQHPAALTPICYTVWYENLAGINPRLSQRMDALLAEGVKLDDTAVRELFKNYCSEFSIDMQNQLRENARRILGDIKQYAASAFASTRDYGGQLAQSADVFSQQSDVTIIQQVIGKLQHDTSSMASTMEGLSQNLARSHDEIDKLRVQLEKARAEAMVDPLTGVMNRRGFDARMDEAVGAARNESTPLSLLLVDIDHFKHVNDTYGHLFGDKVIKGLAEVLKANVKGKDAVARVGGEEFGLLLPETGVDGAFTVAEKIRQMMEKSKIRRADRNEQVGGITVSIGVAALRQAEDIPLFYDRADKALYASKGGGRNRVTVATV
jgi:diguanylate cyclase